MVQVPRFAFVVFPGFVSMFCPPPEVQVLSQQHEHTQLTKPRGNRYSSIRDFFISLNINQIPVTLDLQAKPVVMWCSPSFLPSLLAEMGNPLLTDPSKTFVAFQGRKREHNNGPGLGSVLDKFSCCENK